MHLHSILTERRVTGCSLVSHFRSFKMTFLSRARVNYISYRFWYIQRQIIAWPWNLGYGPFKVIENGTTRKLGYGLLFTFHSKCGYVRDRAIYWPKIAILIPGFDAAVRGVSVRMLPYRLTWRKTRMMVKKLWWHVSPFWHNTGVWRTDRLLLLLLLL